MRSKTLPNHGEGSVDACIGIIDADGECAFDRVTCEFQVTAKPYRGDRHMPAECGDWHPIKITDEEGRDVTGDVTQEQLEMIDKVIQDKCLIEEIVSDTPYERPDGWR